MDYKIILTAIFSLLTSIIITYIGIKILKRIRIKQPILSYVEEHKAKSGTPTMGGIFFVLNLIICYFIFCKISTFSFSILTITIAFSIVGFLDDFLKIKTHNNLGLKPYQKVFFQVIIAFLIGVFAYLEGVTYLNIPFVNKSIELGVFSVFLYVFAVIATTNAVNLTDGLDGLASNVTVWFLVFFSILLIMQNKNGQVLLKNGEITSVIYLNTCLISGLLGFLFFNVNKAKIFMGDTGSLALGGYISMLCTLTSNLLIILVLGICYVISAVSVIMQVLYYKKTKKRIFLMAPYHHHLQKKGLTENKICYIYSLITCIMGGLLLISYF